MSVELVLTGLGVLAGKLAYDITGPFVKDLGEILKTELSPYRAVRQKQLLEKTAKMLAAAELKANPVHPKLLVRIFDEAGLEVDEGLHTMWAALLANAAITDNTPPAFPEILRQLTKADALFLDRLRQHLPAFEKDSLLGGWDDIEKIYESLKEEHKQPLDFHLTLGNLRRLGILTEWFDITTDSGQDLGTDYNWAFLANSPPARENGATLRMGTYIQYHLSRTGFAFIVACQPPNPVSTAE